MKVYLVFAVILSLTVVAFAEENHAEYNISRVHRHRRQNIVKPVQITVKPPKGCVFFECIPSCKQRGYLRGGICTINGCQCLK